MFKMKFTELYIDFIYAKPLKYRLTCFINI